MDTLTTILRGGADKVREAGAVIAGGHTVTDKEPKYGLAVTGTVHPNKVILKGGAKVGDLLILTKPLGTGIITTALKNQKAMQTHLASAVASMSRLNRDASQFAQAIGVNAMTDITGYSLLGHGHEVAHLSHVELHINFNALKWLPGAVEYANQHIFPGGTNRNQQYFEQWIRFNGEFGDTERGLLFDPQTSGGLLMSVTPMKADVLLDQLLQSNHIASIIGKVTPGDGYIVVSK
jgi:selenide,water dikinase